jgi:hypothetical protein
LADDFSVDKKLQGGEAVVIEAKCDPAVERSRASANEFGEEWGAFDLGTKNEPL